MQIRVYNDFKRRLLNGEVSADFPCKAVLLNSAFNNMYDHAAYFRNVNDFKSYSAGSLDKSLTKDEYFGTLLATGKVLETTYYRDTDLNEEDTDSSEMMIVTSANSAAYYPMYARGSTRQNKRFNEYLNHYGYFYLVARADDFHALVSRAQSLNLEKFVVVLADNIEHIDVDSSCFGCSREYPFRGIFDGNGYALCLNTMKIGSRSNGIFGYISDEGIVRNLIISADATNIDATDSEILVSNTQQISLQTLKNGDGDVKFGILAGTNNGTVENVLIDAKLKYNCDFTPSFCFVQNKTDYPTDLLGNGWKQLTSTAFSAATALSAFDNICYPTQLCLNSEANMIPYIGYFNEGSFNTQTVSNSVTAGNPLYTNTKSDASTSYFADIYELYKLKGDNYYAVGNYLRLIGDKTDVDGVMPNNSTALSFRLGPNNKEAYLLGGMFGLNNGNVKHCVCDVQMKFNDNFVALAGGLAGRGARGDIDDVSTRAKFIGTSGVYNHDYQITNNKKENAPASALLSITGFARNSYSHATVGELSATRLTRFAYNFETNQASDIRPNWGLMTSADITTYAERRLDFDTRGTLTLIGSGFQLTTTEVQQDEVDIAGKDVCLIYNYDVQDVFFPPSGYNYVQTFNEVAISGKWWEENPEFELAYWGAMDNRDIDLSQKLSTYSLYAISSRTTNGIKLLTSQTDLLLASAISNSRCKINQNNKISVKDLIVTSEFGIYNTNDPWPRRDAFSGTVKFNLSAYDAKITYDQTSTDDVKALTRMQEYGNINIRLAPVYNMGGMFGEYVYSNAQSVDNSLVCAEASGFKWPENSPSHTRGFGRFNNISHFASNIIIDSSNKSNSDMFLDSFAASANANKRNNLKFYVANVIDGVPYQWGGFSTVNKSVSAVVGSDDCTSAIHGFNTLNIYNQIMPSVVTTNYTDRDDEDIDDDDYDVDDVAPNLGITWLDQLFYAFGLNMGYNGIPGPVDAGDYKLPYKQFNNPSACSGWYFNFPAQGKVFDGVNYKDGRSPAVASSYSTVYDSNFWRHDKVFGASFELTSYMSPAESRDEAGILLTKQCTAYPSHYPLYRGRASIANGALTYAQSAYMKIPATTYLTAYSSIDDKKTALITESNELHANVTTDSYIYEYSQRVYNNNLPQLDAHLYGVYGSLTSYISKTYTENAYVLSSNSYESVYKKNGCVNAHMTPDTCEIVVPSTGLPYYYTFDVGTAAMTECATGAILNFNLHYELLNTKKPTIEVNTSTNARCTLADRQSKVGTSHQLLPNVPASELATIYENKLYITYPFTLPDYKIDTELSLSIPLHIKYEKDDEIKESYTTAYIPIDRAPIDSTNFKFKLDTSTRADNVLSANTLCFGFVPTEDDIISGLDTDPNAKVYARTLSSDDISYMLLLDDQTRPIVDIKLDTTAVASAGLYIELEGLKRTTSQPVWLSSGMLINITK